MNEKHITSVSLCAETEKIAQQMPNRSAFFRECLRRWNAANAETHIHPTETARCYPHSRLGLCPLCWPDGAPTHDQWKYYRQMHQTSGALAAIDEQAKEGFEPRFSVGDMDFSRAGKEREKIPLWKRFKQLFTG